MNENHFNLLAAEIRKELVKIQAIAQEMIEYWQPLQGQELSKVDLRVLGSFLHDFYTCIERIFRRIAVKVDGDIPPGEAWHKDLLNQMSLEIPNLRPAVIDATLFEQL
ncbi:MAG TPA: hypothetical protein VKK79_21805, partial [Candidatus Lokiarchaeia archaeon]|nr:hypothetical protein [Candidatus Lokiarchaeia archaeon]